MNLDELQSVQSRERQTDQLQQLRSTFYEEAGQFVAQLREERERAAERAEDPFDAPEVNRLTNDIKTAEQTVEAVYERRVGKIVKMASLAAADMPTDDGGLTQEERQLFETMVEAIEGNRQHVLDVIAGEAPTGAVGDGSDTSDTPTTGPETGTPADAGSPAQSDPADAAPGGTEPSPTQPSDTSTDPAVDAADIMGGGSGTAEAAPPEPPTEPDQQAGATESETSAATDSVDASGGDSSPDRPPEEALSAAGGNEAADSTERIERKTVRITDEVGEIFGVDQREYDLSTNDVVTLPADNADPLVERDAAEPLE